ncbi:MAG: hypothetical protein Fur0043_26560 [Anaerolineales bacterium]
MDEVCIETGRLWGMTVKLVRSWMPRYSIALENLSQPRRFCRTTHSVESHYFVPWQSHKIVPLILWNKAWSKEADAWQAKDAL